MKAGRAESEERVWWGYVRAILKRVVGGGLSDTVTFEQSPEGGEGVIHVYIWGKSVPGRGDSKCEGCPVVGCLRGCTVVIVTRVEKLWGER